MRRQDFDYDLPTELIAQHPLPGRDRARLMVVDRTAQRIHHHHFFEIDQFLPPESLMVLNDSKVIPARLRGNREKSGGQVEIFLLNRLPDGSSYEAMIRPLRRLKIGEKIVFQKSSIYAELIDAKKRIVRFNRKDISRHLGTIGHLPLPPYIKRADTDVDREYYQTVYAKNSGSVAAPTAGLHFTDSLLQRLKSQSHEFSKVTLHINYATFSPVKEENILQHKMHEEQYVVSAKTQTAILKARGEGRKIVAVGTTSCRVLETLACAPKESSRDMMKVTGGAAPGDQIQGAAPPASSSKPHRICATTNIFIYPGYDFHMTDLLITNFHLPQSTLLMLVYAFGSPALMKKAYQEAITQRYRFYSYGDAMIII